MLDHSNSMEDLPNPTPLRNYDTSREEIPVPPISDDTWKLILDRSNVPMRIQHEFLGEMWVYDVDSYGKLIPGSGRWEEKGAPLMNEHGARFFTSVLISAMTPDKITTWLTDAEVSSMCASIRKTVIFLIGEREDEFEINPSDRRLILDIIDHYYFSNLTASRKGMMMRAMKPTIERRETLSVPKKEGFFQR